MESLDPWVPVQLVEVHEHAVALLEGQHLAPATRGVCVHELVIVLTEPCVRIPLGDALEFGIDLGLRDAVGHLVRVRFRAEQHQHFLYLLLATEHKKGRRSMQTGTSRHTPMR